MSTIKRLIHLAKYRICPTCGGTGTMITGRPNGDDKFFMVDSKGRDISFGGGSGAMRNNVEPCSTCKQWNDILALFEAEQEK